MPQPPFPSATAPAPEGPLLLDGPAGPLEVAVEHPDADTAPRPATAIVCHPLPTDGGTMHNKVVTMTARALRLLGATTVRFNFRGIGASAGTFDEGEGELEDLRAVAAWVREARPDDQLWLCGFSFGAYVALRGAVELGADGVVTVAPPVGRNWDFDRVQPPTVPWLVVQGDADEIVDPHAVSTWVESLRDKPELIRMPDAGHFFHRRLIDLRGAIQNGVRPYLPPVRNTSTGDG